MGGESAGSTHLDDGAGAGGGPSPALAAGLIVVERGPHRHWEVELAGSVAVVDVFHLHFSLLRELPQGLGLRAADQVIARPARWRRGGSARRSRAVLREGPGGPESVGVCVCCTRRRDGSREICCIWPI